jgi:hypothetical protein
MMRSMCWQRSCKTDTHLIGVAPAKAGVPLQVSKRGKQSGIPAFAGMTVTWWSTLGIEKAANRLHFTVASQSNSLSKPPNG